MAEIKPLVLSVGAIGAIIFGGLTVSVLRDPPDADAPTTLENIPAGIVQTAPELTAQPGAPSSSVELPTGPRTTDLDSPPVPPGESVVSEVNLPDGYAPIGELTLTGEATCFKIVASQMIGHTLKVMAKSACETPIKFAATFQYDKAP